MFDLGTPSGYDISFGTGINASEAVVGYSLPGPLGSATFTDGFVGFCCNTSDPVAIGSLGVGGATHAFGINNSGYVTGISNTICCGAYAFLWTSSGGMTNLGGLSNCTFQNIYSIGYAINTSGQITGWSYALAYPNNFCIGAQHHFLYSQGTMTDLNYALPTGYVDYIDPNDEEAGTGIRFSINDNGQITGTATFNGVCCHAYLLSLGPLGNTPAGSSVAVQPSSFVSLTFNTVTAGGNTTVTTSATGPNPPAGFELGSPATYYNLSTTATFSGSVNVCINYAGISFASSPQLFHFNGSSWVNVTTSVNTTASTVCGVVSSLSPFALFSPPKYKVCLLYDPTKGEKPGRTLPIKLQLCDGSGNDESSSSVVVHAVSLTQVSTATSGVVVDSGSANPDNDFRFDSSLGSTGGYIFNLSTKGLATGTYNLNFTVIGDSFVYAAPFQVN